MAPPTVISSVEHTRPNLLIGLIKEIRPKQWTKNLLVFASAIFAGTFLNPNAFLNAAVAFLAFSFMSSSIYIINDIKDVEKDRMHPDKCHRPIASGSISVPQAMILKVIIFISSLALGFILNYQVVIVLLVYFVINLLYSFHLKHVVIVDVMLIAFGFVLRAVAGAVAVGGVLTSWFVLCTLLLSLFLALGKRRHELNLFKESPSGHRKVLDYYSLKLLDQLMTIVTGVAIMFYSMYAATEDSRMMYTIPFVIYGVFRYYYLIHMENAGGKPEDVLLTDHHILVTVILFGASVIVIKQFL